MSVDELLVLCSRIRFNTGPDDLLVFRRRYQSMRAAFEEALACRIRLDCTLFAHLFSAYLFDRPNYDGQTAFAGYEMERRLSCLPSTMRHIGFLAPYDIVRSQAVELSSHGQWLVKPRDDDERWMGLTTQGVEAHTLDEWLRRHSSMIAEAVEADVPAEVLHEAALLSDEWCLWQGTPRRPDLDRMANPDEYRWRIVYTQPRRRVRTRLFVHTEIERARSRID
jgi:hypothetical protein